MKTVHVVVFDVSGSMRDPLKLRSNSRDANKGSGGLHPKRVQTVFDVICRLAEDGIAAAKDQDMYAAVLCFGLRDVSTCDLLALLEERTKTPKLLNVAEVQSTSELPYDDAAALLKAHGIDSAEAQTFLEKVPNPSGRSSSSDQPLYTVVGHMPVVRLLARAGAPYCEEFVENHMTPKSAGEYFMAFAIPDRAKDLDALVDSLPDACKGDDWWSVGTRWTSSWIPDVQSSAVSEATRFADDLIAAKDKKDVRAILKSIPTAAPKPLTSVVQLIKRLQSALKLNEEKDAATDEMRSSPEGSQSTLINWERLLDDIEPYLYGGTPMCEALQSIQPLFQDQAYSSKAMMLISDGGATDGNPLTPAQVLRDAGGTIFACLLTDSAIEEPRRLRGLNEADTKWPSAARAMFDMASTVSCDSGPIQALRRRGWKMPASGQCKLFTQANNPMIIDEFTTASQYLGTSSDALADMIGQISIDDYIQKSNNGAEVTDQGSRSIC